MFGWDHDKRPRDAASVGVMIWSTLDGTEELMIADLGVIITAWYLMKKIRDRQGNIGAQIDDNHIRTLARVRHHHTVTNTVATTENQEITSTIAVEVEVEKGIGVTRTLTPVADILWLSPTSTPITSSGALDSLNVPMSQSPHYADAGEFRIASTFSCVLC